MANFRPAPSVALNRVYDAFLRYTTDDNIQFVDREQDAELVILHVIGRNEQMLRIANRLMEQGKKYIVAQYVLQSSQKPRCQPWMALWNKAEMVWSYYDLYSHCQEEGLQPAFNLYQSPLGVAPHFAYEKASKDWIMMSSGASWVSESVREIHIAAQQIGAKALHLGPDLKRAWVQCIGGVSDRELSQYYSRCHFVAGLRRKDGFELPAAEGLICGARPVLFDQPRYRQWYEEWGLFIPEGPREQVIEELKMIFASGIKPVSAAESRAARALFNWAEIVGGFWTHLATS